MTDARTRINESVYGEAWDKLVRPGERVEREGDTIEFEVYGSTIAALRQAADAILLQLWGDFGGIEKPKLKYSMAIRPQAEMADGSIGFWVADVTTRVVLP